MAKHEGITYSCDKCNRVCDKAALTQIVEKDLDGNVKKDEMLCAECRGHVHVTRDALVRDMVERMKRSPPLAPVGPIRPERGTKFGREDDEMPRPLRIWCSSHPQA